MFQQKYLGFSGGLRYESTPFVLRQYEGSTTRLEGQNIFRHRQVKDNFKTIWKIYILNKVCKKYAEGMQCKSLTLPYS